MERHFYVSQLSPESRGSQDIECQRFKETIEQLNTRQTPPIYVTEGLEPGDGREALPQFKDSKAKELVGLAHSVF